MPQKRLKINFVGSFTTGYVGEVADEIHLARELDFHGFEVVKVPRDQWKAYVDGNKPNDDWVLPQKADLNIICKWHHFGDEKYINRLREETQAPVFYWTWDFMDYDENGFHYKMAKASDLLLANDGIGRVPPEIKYHYFPFDVADRRIREKNVDEKYDVVFFGSHIQKGDRVEWIKEINKKYPVTIFSWNYKDWQKEGLTANPPVWGDEFAKVVSQSRIILQFSVNDHTWGYWSNRVGKILSLGGFLLARYAPGMELFLRDGCEYFSSIDEALTKIDYYLEHRKERYDKAREGFVIGRNRFTSIQRIKDLKIVIERYLAGGL